MSDDLEEELPDQPSTAARPRKRGRRSTAPLPREGAARETDGEEGEQERPQRAKERGRPAAGSLTEERQATRRSWLAFGGGVLTGLILLPLLLGLLLSLVDGPERLRPTPPQPGQPDLVVDLSREYLERTALISANKRDGLLKVREPNVELAPHPAGGARMVVRAQVELPLIGAHGIVATLHLAAVAGELQVATEQIAVGQDGDITLPGQRLIKGWLDDLVNDSVQERLQANSRYRVEVTDVSAASETLTVKALLKER